MRAVLACSFALAGSARAGEPVRIPVPEGWVADTAAWDAGPGCVAVALHQDTYPTTEGRVVQVRKGRTVSTTLPGKIFGLSFSPDGTWLIASHATCEEGPCTHYDVSRVTLLDEGGTVVWTRDYPRTAYAWFGLTGESIYLRSDGISLLDLRGRPVSGASVPVGHMDFPGTLSEPPTLVRWSDHAFTAYDLLTGTRTWSIPGGDFPTVHPTGASTFAILRNAGGMEIRSASGDLVAGPFSCSEMYPGPEEGKAWCTDVSGTVAPVDLRTGRRGAFVPLPTLGGEKVVTPIKHDHVALFTYRGDREVLFVPLPGVTFPGGPPAAAQSPTAEGR